MPKGMTKTLRDRSQDGDNPHVRDVAPAEMATLLRAVLGLHPHQPLLDEQAADLRRPFPMVITGVSTGPWIAWCLVGLALFSGPGLPNMRAVVATAKRVVIALALLRTNGSLTRASAMLGTSRRTARDSMKDSELYPWYRGPDDENGPPRRTSHAPSANRASPLEP